MKKRTAKFRPKRYMDYKGIRQSLPVPFKKIVSFTLNSVIRGFLFTVETGFKGSYQQYAFKKSKTAEAYFYICLKKNKDYAVLRFLGINVKSFNRIR